MKTLPEIERVTSLYAYNNKSNIHLNQSSERFLSISSVYNQLINSISSNDSISYRYKFFSSTIFAGAIAAAWLVVQNSILRDAAAILFAIISTFCIGSIMLIAFLEFLNKEYKESTIRTCIRIENNELKECGINVKGRFNDSHEYIKPFLPNLVLILFYLFPIISIYILEIIVFFAIEGIKYSEIVDRILLSNCINKYDTQINIDSCTDIMTKSKTLTDTKSLLFCSLLVSTIFLSTFAFYSIDRLIKYSNIDAFKTDKFRKIHGKIYMIMIPFFMSALILSIFLYNLLYFVLFHDPFF